MPYAAMPDASSKALSSNVAPTALFGRPDPEASSSDAAATPPPPGDAGDDENFDADIYDNPPAWALTPVLPKPPKRSGFFTAVRSPLKELERTR